MKQKCELKMSKINNYLLKMKLLEEVEEEEKDYYSNIFGSYYIK